MPNTYRVATVILLISAWVSAMFSMHVISLCQSTKLEVCGVLSSVCLILCVWDGALWVRRETDLKATGLVNSWDFDFFSWGRDCESGLMKYLSESLLVLERSTCNIFCWDFCSFDLCAAFCSYLIDTYWIALDWLGKVSLERSSLLNFSWCIWSVNLIIYTILIELLCSVL